ncbi:MAG: ATP-binding cassette domain-containing protein, partial [Candidatus Hydrogenedentales bacterium]
EVDGIDIRNMTRENLRSCFGMVLQDTWLFNGSIRDNIAYGATSKRTGSAEDNAVVSTEDILAASKAAYVHHFVKTLPEGYDTVLTDEASNISQGQKQLLTIARAILANPPMLILDEATSSVDTHTEVLIQKAMSVLMKGRTSFIIAHRLSTIRDADWILVMDHGDIVEQGTHESLIAGGGFYANLYNSQFDKLESA